MDTNNCWNPNLLSINDYFQWVSGWREAQVARRPSTKAPGVTGGMEFQWLPWGYK